MTALGAPRMLIDMPGAVPDPVVGGGTGHVLNFFPSNKTFFFLRLLLNEQEKMEGL